MACLEPHRGGARVSTKENDMNAAMKVLAAVALLGAVVGCAQLGIPAPSGVTTVDPPIYEPSPGG